MPPQSLNYSVIVINVYGSEVDQFGILTIYSSLGFSINFASTLGGDSQISKWRIHLLKGLVQTAVSAHLQRFGE
jgi:hypothetical protein